MCPSLGVLGRLISNGCRYMYHCVKLNCLKQPILFSYVNVDGDVNEEDHLILERFYLCQHIHTVRKLVEVLQKDFVTLRVIYDGSLITISRVDKTITYQLNTKKIKLGDISLDYILDDTVVLGSQERSITE